ncbi:MAG: glycoside hydrolase domain-containing protein [Phycisphaerae bacterium]
MIVLWVTTSVAAPVAFGPGCGARDRTKVALPVGWAADPTERIEASEPVRTDTPLYRTADNVIRLAGAINETVAFNYVLSAEDGRAEGLELSVEDLVAPEGLIPPDRVRMYRPWPITVTRFPNWYLRSLGLRKSQAFPDTLVPIDAPRRGQPFTIEPGAHLPIWVDIRIPADAAAGTYRSHVVVRDGRGKSRRTPIELKVMGTSLPRAMALPVMARVDLRPIITAHTSQSPDDPAKALRDEATLHVIRRAFEILHEHGLSAYTDQIHPAYRQDLDGSIVIDWTEYDAICGPWIDGSAYDDGVAAHAWPLPVNLSQPDPGRYDGIDSVRYNAVLRKYLSDVRDHFETRGWLKQAFVWFDLPRRPGPVAAELARIRKLAEITHVVDRRLAFASTLIPQPMAPFGWVDHRYEDFSGLIDIWATPARYEHPPTLERQRILGALTWLSPDRPPFSGSLAVEASPVDARSLPWQAFLHGHDAIFLSQVTQWPAGAPDVSIDDPNAPSDAWLLYPGTPFGLDEPVPSVRLKRLQLGLQDYQYLRLLDETGHGETARLAARSLIKAAGTDAYGDSYQDGLPGRRVTDPDAWRMGRTLLTEELANTVGETPGRRITANVNQAAWRAFLRKTRRIEVWAESARLSLDQRQGQSGYLVAFGAGVLSELRTPLSGTLTFGLLPPDWRSVSDIVRVGPIEEMAFARSRLTAAMPGLPRCDLDGHLLQTLHFDGGASGSRDAEALLSIVLATRAPNPITVDGALDDWPPSTANVAGDFRVLTGGGASESPRARAERQTIAYFSHDGESLFIGIRAAKAAPSSPSPVNNRRSQTRRYGSVVRYEDLMPRDEDLVEIVIDPTNAATQSGDLFHIVLKATGQAVFETGIGTVPAIGPCRPWPAGAQWMIEDSPESWSAELAIPVRSFGATAAEMRIWGVNIARLEPTRGEYSDWSGAVRYCYDPRTLGNLVWED